MRRILDNPAERARLAAAGVARARDFRWETGAASVYEAYAAAVRDPRRRR
jgi:glycosyltransferase involved in cell wall biosynthesis